jgi:hypothetical protein
VSVAANYFAQEIRYAGAMLYRFAGGLARVEQRTMVRLLSRMERDEISLTGDAEKHLPKARAILFAGSEDALSGLGADEVTQLVELLERVNANLKRMSEQTGNA